MSKAALKNGYQAGMSESPPNASVLRDRGKATRLLGDHLSFGVNVTAIHEMSMFVCCLATFCLFNIRGPDGQMYFFTG